MVAGLYGGFLTLGIPLLGGPNNKEYTILGSILGPLILGGYHIFQSNITPTCSTDALGFVKFKGTHESLEVLVGILGSAK